MFLIPFKTSVMNGGSHQDITGLVQISLNDNTMTNCYGFNSDGVYVGKYISFERQASIKTQFIFDRLPIAFYSFMNETFKAKGGSCVAALEIAKVGSSWETRLCVWNGADFIPTIAYDSIPFHKYRIVINYNIGTYSDAYKYQSWSNKSVYVRPGITGLSMPGYSFSAYLDGNGTFANAIDGEWLPANCVNIDLYDVTNDKSLTLSEMKSIINLIDTSDEEVDINFIKW